MDFMDAPEKVKESDELQISKLIKSGRKQILKSSEEMQERVDAYFKACEEIDPRHNAPTPTSIAGLSLALGLHGRKSVFDYIQRGEACGCGECDNCKKSNILKESKARIVQEWLPFIRKTTPTGAIYYLKTMGLWDTPAAYQLSLGKEGEQVASINISFSNGPDKQKVAKVSEDKS